MTDIQIKATVIVIVIAVLIGAIIHRASRPLTTDWSGHIVTAETGALHVLNRKLLGLRSDGVVVWKEQ